jgi:undecaprenyl-diphosphatase
VGQLANSLLQQVDAIICFVVLFINVKFSWSGARWLAHCRSGAFYLSILMYNLSITLEFGEMQHVESDHLTPAQATILGVVEGVTEYLPISSTGHLVLASEFMGLNDSTQASPAKVEAVKSFEIVIQFGAIIAVLYLYRRYVADMIKGCLGRSKPGLKLFINTVAAFIPTAVIALALKGFIKAQLQSTVPVIVALLVGGIFMILFARSKLAQTSITSGKTVYDLSIMQAAGLGVIQCLALWPGTSRSMVTIAGGIFMGLSAVAAAEFSFILGLVTLSAASVYSFYKDGVIIIEQIGPTAIVIGLVTATISAGLAVKWLVSFLNRRGLAPFGWYRIAIGMALLVVFRDLFA